MRYKHSRIPSGEDMDDHSRQVMDLAAQSGIRANEYSKWYLQAFS